MLQFCPVTVQVTEWIECSQLNHLFYRICRLQLTPGSGPCPIRGVTERRERERDDNNDDNDDDNDVHDNNEDDGDDVVILMIVVIRTFSGIALR